MSQEYPTPIYETTGYIIERQMFGEPKREVTLHLKREAVDGVLEREPGLHTYITIAGKVVLLPGVLRGNN